MYCREGKTAAVDSPVIISDEEYYSPAEDGDNESKDGWTSVTKRFASNFTASGEDMIDLTVNNSNSSSGVQTPESSQRSAYPHIKLLDFLSPGVSPKDLVSSIKKNITSPRISGNANSSLVEPDSPDMPDASVVARYGVTARSPVGSDEPIASPVRQISPPQNPDELKRAALLPPDMRATTPVNTSIAASSLMSARVSIRKLDSPSSVLTTSINQGMVSLRKKQSLRTSFNISSTTGGVTSDSSQYKFSPPVEVLSQDKISGSQGVNKGPSSHHSANISFPFSPPLTRSQRRKTVNQDSLNASKVELFSETIFEADADPAIDMAEPDEPKESGKKKQKVSTSEVTTTTTKRAYHTRYVLSLSQVKYSCLFLIYSSSKTRSTPRVGSNYDTVLLHPMPTPGSTPSKENVTTRKPRQKAKSMNKPPLNLRRSSRLLDSSHTDSRRH